MSGSHSPKLGAIRRLGGGGSRGGAQSEPECELIIVTDPGPDPDDVKAVLIAGVLHTHGEIVLRGVVANGGGVPRERARLARALLDHLGAHDVPVGVGSAGEPCAAQPHELRLAGVSEVPDSALVDGHELLTGALRGARPRGLTILIISSLRDVADVLRAQPELFESRTREVAVMGGLVRAEGGGWAPDTSVNNSFDMAAAADVYAFCLGRAVPLTVVSRHAVPMLPMQLAKSFAVRTKCPVMHYLADAQFLGLGGLWQRLCAGELPARCTKQWYFETFCGVDAERFGERAFEQLDAHADITAHLNGYVKPYDVIALMSVLPHTRALFDELMPWSADGAPSAEHGAGGGAGSAPGSARGSPASARAPPRGHRLLLSAEHAVDARHVAKLLRNTYHEVVLATQGHDVEPPASPEMPVSLRATLTRNSRESLNSSGAFSPHAGLRRAAGGGGVGSPGGGGCGMTTVRSTPARLNMLDRLPSGGGVLASPLRLSRGSSSSGMPPPEHGGGGGGGAGPNSRLRGQLSESAGDALAAPLVLHAASDEAGGHEAGAGATAAAAEEAAIQAAAAAAAAATDAAACGCGPAAAASPLAKGGSFRGRRHSGLLPALEAHPRALPPIASSAGSPLAAPHHHAQRLRARAAGDAPAAPAAPAAACACACASALSSSPASRAPDAPDSLAEAASRPPRTPPTPKGRASGLTSSAAAAAAAASAAADGPRAERWAPLELLTVRHPARTDARARAHAPAAAEEAPSALARAARALVGAPPACTALDMLGARRGGTLPPSALACALDAALSQARAAQHRFLRGAGALGGALTLGAHVGAAVAALGGGADGACGARWLALGGPDALRVHAHGAHALGALDSAALCASAGALCAALALQPTVANLGLIRVVCALLCALVGAHLLGLGVGVYVGLAPECGLVRSAWWPLLALSAQGCAHACALLWLCACAPRHWLRPRLLARRTVQAMGGLVLCSSGSVLLARAAAPLSGRAAAPGAWASASLGCASAGSLLAALLLLSPSARARVRAKLARALGGRGGPLAPLAPLIGFGTVHEADVDAFVGLAAETFHPRALDGATADSLLPARGGGADGAAEAEAEAEARARGGAAHGAGAAEKGAGAAGAGGVRGRAGATVTPWPRAPHGATGTAPTEPAGGGGGGAAAPLAGGGAWRARAADYYVLHCEQDSAHDRAAALRAWGARQVGAPPVVWLDTACADPALRAHEALHLRIGYMAQCRRLLLLAGPCAPDSLRVAVELFVWLALGGRMQDVEVVLVAHDEQERQRVLAGFDIFHVMLGRSSCPEERERLVRAVELATVGRFNELVRSFVPLVRAAVQSADDAAGVGALAEAKRHPPAGALPVPAEAAAPHRTARSPHRISTPPPAGEPVPPAPRTPAGADRADPASCAAPRLDL